MRTVTCVWYRAHTEPIFIAFHVVYRLMTNGSS